MSYLQKEWIPHFRRSQAEAGNCLGQMLQAELIHRIDAPDKRVSFSNSEILRFQVILE